MTTLNEKPSPPVDGRSAENGGEGTPLSRAYPFPGKIVPPTAQRTIWDRLPPWISHNIRSSRSRKMLLRCWIGSWVAFVILLPQKSLNVLGNAAFFALLASFMVPAYIPVQLFLFALTTMVVGMCMGWAFGAAGMKAALAARNQLLLKESLQREAQSVAGLSNPDALFAADIFAGKFLDLRSSVVFGVFLGLGNFVFALIRAYAPKLILMSVFGTIAIDIFCSYGPLFPFPQYTLINSVLISVACYVALGIVIIIFIFPETVNHAALVSISDMLGKIKSLIDMQQQVLESAPDDLARDTPLLNKLQGTRMAIMTQMQQLIGSIKFIALEFSWGKWNGNDVKALQQPLMAVVSRSAALQSFPRLVGHPWTRDSEMDEDEPMSSSASSTSSDSNAPSVGDTHLLRQLRARNHAAEVEYSVRIADVMPVIEDTTSELRAACSASLGAVQAVLVDVNTRRWSFRKIGKKDTEAEAHLAGLDEAIEHLRETLQDFKDHKRLALVEPFQRALAEAATTKKSLPLRSLYVSYVFAVTLIVLADSVLALMELVQTTAAKRTRRRLWVPRGLRALITVLTTRSEMGDEAAGEDTVPQPEDEVMKEERSFRLDPDSLPPTNAFQRFAGVVHVCYTWTKTPEALFALRYVILSIALWIPSVVRTTAHFMYVEKAIWALIMAQTTLNIYASDQIFNYVTRILGTFIGAVWSVLTWYLGNAGGNGNPYGSAAAVGVLIIPILFLRLFAPPQYLPGSLLLAVTFDLVMGYSWIDGHLPLVGSPGIGWPVAWKRFVTVMIGSAASFIMMMFPPKSGRKAVRLRNAGTIMSLSFLYSDIVAAWISTGDGPAHEKQPLSPSGSLIEWIPGFRDRLLGLVAQLQAVKMQTAFAKWEGSIRGRWPRDEYARLADVQMEMTASLAVLGGALLQIDEDMRLSFLHHTRVVNPNFIADVMATFSIVSQALRTGEPIPQAFHQNLFDRLHYHGNVGRHSFTAQAAFAHEEAHQHHAESLTRYEYMFYATAISAVFQLLDGLNELRSIAIRLCGELPLRGYARWKDEYDKLHVIPSAY